MDIVPFCALHSSRHLRDSLERSGLDRNPLPVRLPLPRQLLNDFWVSLRLGRVEHLSRRLANVNVIHAPSVAIPPRGKVPLVVTVHDVAPLLFPETFPRHGLWFHRQGLRAAAKADLVITVSESAADEIRMHTRIDPARIRVIHNGVDRVEVTKGDIERTAASFGLDERPWVLWVGSLEPRKNVGVLVRAFAALLDDTDLPHQLVLAGPRGWLDASLVPESLRLRLGDRLRLVGRVDDTDLHALYAGAHAFAFPSRHEGFGLPMLEAMSHGVPVVRSAIPALDEVAGSGTSMAVPPDDIDAWAAALHQALTDAALREDLAMAGRTRAGELSWERCVAATARVYHEASEESSRGRR